VLTFTIAVFPVFSSDVLSMNDVYNHVARAEVLAHYASDPALQTYWTPNWRLVPYLGYDLVSVGLLSLFGAGFVVKVMTALSLLMLFGGGVLLSRAARADGPPAH